MTRTPQHLAVAAIAVLATACSDLPSNPQSDALTAASAAFSSVPLGFSDLMSSYAGDADGVPSLWLPGSRSVAFGGGGMMGGGIGDAFVGGVGRGRGFGNHGPFGGPLGSNLNCTGAFSAASGRFVCETLTRDGLTTTRSAAYTNAAGQVQQAFDSVTTNTVNVRSEVTGTVTYARDSTGGDSTGRHGGPGRGHHFGGHIAGDTTTILAANTTVNHSSDRTVAGLAQGSTQRTVNGTSAGRESTTGTSSRGAFTAARSAADTTRGVVIPLADGKPTYPTAGTVIRVMQATVTYAGQAAAASSRREVVTYDGSATAKVVIVQDGTTKNCTMPLPRGRLSCE